MNVTNATDSAAQPALVFCNEACRILYRHKHGKPVECGCGKGHKMEPFGSWIVHHNGQHWVMDCLTAHLINSRVEDNKVILLLRKRMQKHQGDIAKMRCAGPTCENPVGKTYRVIGDAVYCNHCTHELGGQG